MLPENSTLSGNIFSTGIPVPTEGKDMNQELDKAIYTVLRSFEGSSGVGSSPTANEIIRVVKPFYSQGSEQEKRDILARLENLRKEPLVCRSQ
jgi:hypothetical protein